MAGNKQFNNLMESINSGFIIIQDEKVVYINSHAAQRFGLPKSKIIGKHFLDFVPKDQLSKYKDRYSSLLLGDQKFEDIVVQIVNAKKEIRILQLNIIPLDFNDKPARVIHAKDITEEIEIKNALQANSEHCDLIKNTSLDGFWVIGPEEDILDVNDAYCDMSGYSRKELLKMKVRDIEIGVREKERAKIVNQLLKTGFARYQAYHKMKDGNILYLEASSSYSEKFNNFHIYFKNITEHRKAEEKFRNLFENSADAIFLADLKNRKLIDCNKQAEVLMEMDISKILSMHADQLHPEDVQKKTIQHFKQHTIGKKILVESIVLTGNNKRIPVSINSSVVEIDGKERLLGIFRDISAQKEADVALKKSEGKFRSILENVQLIGVMLDPKANILFANNFLLKKTGWKRKEIMGKNWFDLFISKELRSEFKEIFRQTVKEDNITTRYLNAIKTKSGRELMVNWSNTSQYDINGKIESVTSFGEDVTNQKQAENDLKESEARFRNVIEHSNQIYYLQDINNNLIYVSPQCKNIMGYNQEEMLVNWTTLASDNPMNNLGYEKTMSAIKTGKRQSPYKLEMVRKDGNKIIVRIDESPVKNNIGEIIGITGSVEDVTKQIKAEIDLKKSEEKFRSVIENIQLLGIMLDENAEIIFANDFLLKKTGWRKNEVINKNYFEIFVSKENRLRSQKRFDEIVANGEVFASRTNEVITKKGERLIVDWSVTAQYDENGKLIAATSIGQDITKQKKAEADLSFQSELIKQSHESILTTDLDFKISWVNQAFTNLYGYNKKEVLGKTPEFLNAEPLIQDIQDEIYDKMNKGEVYRGIHINKRKNGSEFYCDMWIFPVRNVKGEMIAYSGHQLDITDEIETQNALITSESRFRSIFESVAEGVILVDRKGKILFANNALCKLTGLENIDIIGNNALSLAKKFIDVKQVPTTIKAVQSAMRGKQFKPYDIEINNKILEVSVTFNKLNKNIVGVLRDITEVTHTTKKLNKYQDHLEELVEKRTLELKEKNAELDNTLKVFVGREITIKTLRNEVDKLKQKLNKA